LKIGIPNGKPTELQGRVESYSSLAIEWNRYQPHHRSNLRHRPMAIAASSHGGVWEIIIGFEVVWDCGFGARKWRHVSALPPRLPRGCEGTM